jgi:hypothetical protein
VHLEVLMPAFVIGCVARNPHHDHHEEHMNHLEDLQKFQEEEAEAAATRLSSSVGAQVASRVASSSPPPSPKGKPSSPKRKPRSTFEKTLQEKAAPPPGALGRRKSRSDESGLDEIAARTLAAKYAARALT